MVLGLDVGGVNAAPVLQTVIIFVSNERRI